MKDIKTNLRCLVGLKNNVSVKYITLVLICIGVVWQSAYGATLTVNDSGDQIIVNSVGGTCTLREAVVAINQENLTLPGASGPSGCVNSGSAFGTNNQILFDIDRTITMGLPIGGLPITNNVSINPAGLNQRNITFNANNRSRHFSVVPPATDVEFSNIVFTNGRVETDVEFAGSLVIQNANVTINNSTFTNNFASVIGGAIVVAAQQGDNDAILNINNSTISGNSTNDRAGAIAILDIDDPMTTLNLTNTTISNNTSGVLVQGTDALMTLTNSIIANSTNFDCDLDQNATVTSDAQSIIENDNCNSGARAVDPGLIGLSNNGGGTPTHALGLDSVAVNTGDNSTCLATDQRGEIRPQHSLDICDVGSFEQNDSDREQLNTILLTIPLDNNRAVVVPL